MRHGMHMESFAGPFSSIFSLIILILSCALLYVIIRLAVRHGIDSSDVARRLRERESKDDEDRQH